MRLAFKDQLDGYYEIEINEGDPLPSWVSNLTPTSLLQTPAPLRSAWEASAKKKADELLVNAIDIIARMRSGYAFGSIEYIYLSGLLTTFTNLTAVTNLSASNDEASAYLILENAYKTAVAQASTPLRLEYASAIRQKRSAGFLI